MTSVKQHRFLKGLAHATPVASNAANFSAAVPLPPDIMAPA